MNTNEVWVRAAATTPISLTGVTSVDGVTPIEGEFFLLTQQVYPVLNGIYTYSSSGGGTLTIAPPYNTAALISGITVLVLAGTTNSRTQWIIQVDVLGSSTPSYNVRVAQAPGFVVDNIPPGLVYGSDQALYLNQPNETAIQRTINNLLQYDEGLGNINSYWKTQDVAVASPPSITSTDIGTLFRSLYSSGITSPTTFDFGPGPAGVSGSVYIALLGDSKIKFTFTGTSGTVNLYDSSSSTGGTKNTMQMRFQGAKAFWNGTTWAVTDAYVSSGGTVRLPGGTIFINSIGIKLHPTVSVIGDGEGATILQSGGSGFSGSPDSSVSGEQAALLYVCARAPYPGADSSQFFNPTIQGINFATTTTVSHINGIYFETGGVDPFYPPPPNYNTPLAYKGSSASIYNCVVKGFGGFGVIVQPDRQRFYCEGLRCFGNGKGVTNAGGGIIVKGADSVIGPRSGFGSNVGTSVQISDCSGVIMTGVNVWESSIRNQNGLACQLINMSGSVVSNCKFSDTVSIEVGTSATNYKEPIVLTRCQFRPNDGVFDTHDMPNWIAGAGQQAEYDAFIRVAGVANVNVSGCSFGADDNLLNGTTWRTYGAIISSVSETVGSGVSPGACVFTGSIISGGLNVGNYRNASPIYVGTQAIGDLGAISFDIFDLTTGASINGSMGFVNSSGTIIPAAAMRGVDPGSIANFQGYAAVDSGPLLQLSNPELSESSSLSYVNWNPSTIGSIVVPVPARVKYLILDVSSTPGASAVLTLNFMTDSSGNTVPPVHDSIVTICTRTTAIPLSHLRWEYQGGTTFPTGSDTLASLPSSTSLTGQIEVLVRGTSASSNPGAVNVIGNYT